MSLHPSIAAFQRDLVVSAGAGTGKTHALTGLYLRLVAGLTALGRVAPGRICALTFTEKAAAEMRSRLRDAMARAAAGADEELAAAYQAAGMAPLSAAEWEERVLALAGAPIATFHSFAASVVRRSAAELGVDPAFRVLDEGDAGRLLADITDRCLQRALDRPDVVSVVAQIELETARGHGLKPALRELVRRLAESELAEPALAQDAGEARALVLERVRAAQGAIAGVERDLARGLQFKDRWRLEPAQAAAAALTRAERALGVGLTVVGGARADGGEVAPGSAAEDELRAAVRALDKAGKGARDRVAPLRECGSALAEAVGDLLAAPLASVVLTLFHEVRAAYQAAKAARCVLDFADLMNGLGDLARGPGRAELAGGFDAVLVDEVQDSSRVQGALVDALCSAGARRFLVGDRKQAIYDFRGADVAVFAAAEAALLERGGERVALRDNRRSRPGVLAFANDAFARAMTRGDHDFDVRFEADDALVPTRAGDQTVVELLTLAPREGELASDRRAREARAIAQRIGGLMQPGSGVVIEPKDGAPARAPRLGDIAILLRRFTQLDVYLAQLRARQIPYYVVKGRGFFEAQEVRDLSAALTLLVDADDALALLTVLRSPLVGLSDRSLVELAGGEKLRVAAVRRALAGGAAGVPDDQLGRLRRYFTVHERLGAGLDRLGPGGVLRGLVAALDLEAVLAAGFHGEQRLANLARLCDLADQAGPGAGGARRFVRELDSQVEAATVAPAAQVLAESDDVVRVMTVHQAKGLEFNVVFVPDCGAREVQRWSDSAYDRDLGFALRLPGGKAAAYDRVQKRQQLREEAQSLRLFYVAATRARDYLVLSGENAFKGGNRTWRHVIDQVVAGPGGAAVRVTPAESLREVPAAREPALAELFEEMQTGAALAGERALLGRDLVEVAEARAAVARALAARPRPATLVASVTALADFQRCARRYFYRHELGLEEHPRRAPGEDDSEVLLEDIAGDPDDDGSRSVGRGAAGAGGWPAEGLGARGRGALVHRVLELCDLEVAARDPLRALEAALARAGGERASADELARVRADVLRWLGSAGARRHLLARPAAVRREEPFALVVGEGVRVLVKGQIDVMIEDGPDDSGADGAVVLDYKHSRSDAGHDHGFQLQAYALAAQRALGRGRVRVGLVWLADRDPSPTLRAPGEAELEDFRVELAALGGALTDARARDDFKGSPREHCEKIRCGYLGRCHPDRPG